MDMLKGGRLQEPTSAVETRFKLSSLLVFRNRLNFSQQAGLVDENPFCQVIRANAFHSMFNPAPRVSLEIACNGMFSVT